MAKIKSRKQSYWNKRAEDTILRVEKYSETYKIEQLKHTYNETLRRLKNDLNEFYSKFATKNGISYEEAMRVLSKSQQKSYAIQLKEYYAEAHKAGNDGWAKNLATMSARTAVSRIKALSVSVQHEIEMLNYENRTALGSELVETYTDTYYREVYGIEQSLGVQIQFTKVNTTAAEKAVSKDWLSGNFKTRSYNDKVKLLQALNTILPQAMILGKSVQEVTAEIKDELNISYNRAYRLARTEMLHSANESLMDMYEDTEVIEKIEFIATLDKDTCPECASMDGAIIPLADRQPGVNTPTLHPYCRCCTAPHFDNDEVQYRRLAQDRDGNPIVIEDMDYDEWYEKYIA